MSGESLMRLDPGGLGINPAKNTKDFGRVSDKTRPNYQDTRFRWMMVCLMDDDEYEWVRAREVSRKHPLDTLDIWREFAKRRGAESWWEAKASSSHKTGEMTSFDVQTEGFKKQAYASVKSKEAKGFKWGTQEFWDMERFHFVDRLIRKSAITVDRGEAPAGRRV